ncbi:MAG: restriction endonuclease subunit S [Gemmatimonadaceae bacterium]
MSRSNTMALVGATALVDQDYPNLHLPDLIWALDLDPRADPAWFASYLQTARAKRELQRRAAGTSGSMKKLSRHALESLPILVPPKMAQRWIIQVLSDAQHRVATIGSLINAKQRLKHGLMRQLLTGSRRFIGFEATPWLAFRLGELFTERVEVGRADLPLLSISADRGIVPREEMIRRDTSSDDKSKYRRITPGDIGYNTMRMWQGVSALSQLEGIVSPAYTICIPGERIHGPFAAHLFKLPRIVDRFRRHSQGLVDDTLNLKFHHFAQIAVSIPGIEEQCAIAALLDALDKDLAILKQLRDALDRQRRGIAELLLTGKVRVPA